MMPSEVTELLRPLRAAYYTSVREIALDIIRDLTDKRKEDGQDWSSADVIREADLSDVYDAITGYVDGCSWVIFTKSAEAVVIVSDNHDAADDTESPTIELTLEDAESGSHQGPCDDDVAALVRKPYIRAQLDALSRDDIRMELRETGAWEAEELEDDDENRERLVWIGCCNIREEMSRTEVRS